MKYLFETPKEAVYATPGARVARVEAKLSEKRTNDRLTDRWTSRPTGTETYRVAGTQLKKCNSIRIWLGSKIGIAVARVTEAD